MTMEVSNQLEFNWEQNLRYFTEGDRRRPRLGKKHQVQIPPITSTSEYIQLLKYPNDSEALDGDLYSHETGLPVPVFWSEAEKDAFLLGLYMFGKNFVQLKNFMGNKHMGQILGFYYGTIFYKSERFCRWSNSCCSKKTNIKKSCITFASKIFKGRRMDQILSHLDSHVSDDLRTTLLEISVSFEVEKTSVEDFVSFLKAIVGINVLLDAVGIGKRDFTIFENTNRVSPRLLPNGKALSSLMPSDIVRHLSGSFLLNKDWCEDIFWEAVWPRLLARGWHSEEPINQGYIGCTLVFLVPGIEKFSRRGLKKKDQYFDSIIDVMKKVVDEPNLIELKSDNERGPDEGRSDQVGAERSSINNDTIPPLKRRRITTDGPTSEYISAFDTPDPGTERKISAICIDLTHLQELPPRNLGSQNNSQDQSTSDRIVPRMSARADTDVKVSEQPPTGHTRRQSSRNRPLSTKALEALESGLWVLPARTRRSKDRKPETHSGQSRIKTSPTQSNIDNTVTRNPKRAKGIINEAVVGNYTARQPLNAIQENRLSDRQ